MVQVSCRVCGQVFEAKRRSKRYCNECYRARQNEANQRSYDRHIAKASRVQRTRQRAVVCQRCGAEFVSSRSDAKWCSDCTPLRRLERERLFETSRRHSCQCGTSITRIAKLCKHCDAERRKAESIGENNPFWKGGRSKHADGYVYLRTERNGLRKSHAEHIIIWEQSHGPLEKGWEVHHLNGIRDDNRLENLAAMPKKRHPRNTYVALLQAHIHDLEKRLP